MSKGIVDLKESVYVLATTVDGFLDVMEELGFGEMKNCVRTNPRTKVMTLPMVAKHHEADLANMISRFKEKGYTVVNG